MKGPGSMIKYDTIIVMVTDHVRNFIALNFVIKAAINLNWIAKELYTGKKKLEDI